MEEIWKDIKDYEGYYQISNFGRVKSLDRIITHSSGKKYSYKGMFRITQINRCGYVLVHLRKLHLNKLKSIHRLVAEHFIPNPLNLPFVNHKDGNKENNREDNLEWVTQSENEKHAHLTGLKSTKGNRNAMVKISENQVYEIRNRYKNEKISQDKLAKEYGISQTQIYRIVNNKRWKHL